VIFHSYSSIGFEGEPSRQPSAQQEIYDELGSWLLDSTFQGYNTSIFAYGQTGSGKSFTMFGGDGAYVDTTAVVLSPLVRVL